MNAPSTHPDFPASLRLLSQHEQYSDTDIALMFGLSRERIRQLRERYRLPRVTCAGLNAMRIWDDSASAFRPVSRGSLTRESARRRVEAKKRAWLSLVAARRVHVIQTIHNLYAALGRTPATHELAAALGLRNVSAISVYWAGGSYRSRAGVFPEIWKAAGVLPREKGQRGHVGPRVRATHCRKGHPLSGENVYEYRGGNRQCRTCKRANRRASRERRKVAA